jgi:tripartite-type tricarboxylate transporter receptor subunit TctC
MAGYVDMAIGGGALVGPGKIRQLAVGDDERDPTNPDVPTLKELGYDCGYNSSLLLGYFAPKGLPANVKAKLVDAANKTMAKYGKEIQNKLFSMQMVEAYIDGPTATTILRQKEKVFKQLVPKLGLTFN